MINPERSTSPEVEKTQITPTGIVHRFKNPAEYIMIKSMEIKVNLNDVLAKAYGKTKLFLEEGCFNRLCGAPTSAHVMVGA